LPLIFSGSLFVFLFTGRGRELLLGRALASYLMEAAVGVEDLVTYTAV
jgi:hypothetical protein